jgi:hypothetical protein
LNRTYSAGQIATLSRLSHGTVEELVRFGLLNPRGGLFGFRDLASARQISNLFAHGISLSEIIRSVNEVRAWLPEADLSPRDTGQRLSWSLAEDYGSATLSTPLANREDILEP